MNSLMVLRGVRKYASPIRCAQWFIETGQRLVGKQILRLISARVDIAQLREQNVKVLGRKAGEAQYRTGSVNETADGKTVLRQTRLQRGVTVETSTRVQQKLRRST